MSVLHMMHVFKNKRSAAGNGLLGEGGQDPRSDVRELMEAKDEKGRERTSAVEVGREDERREAGFFSEKGEARSRVYIRLNGFGAEAGEAN